MVVRLFVLLLIWVFGCQVGWALRPAEVEHPRLLFPASAEAAIKEKIAKDPLAAALQRDILKKADVILGERTSRFEKRDGRRLLAESRLALHNIVHCGWAWRTTGEQKYLVRAIAEMEAMSAMPHWNPDHFLDVAEMSAAMAIGFDWFYLGLSAEQRSKFAQQLDTKGLQELLNHSHPWWKNATNNWAQVCGAGMEFAAIALDEIYPERCAKVREESRNLLEKCVHFYLPDGAYPEGPGYWHYGSNYQVLHMAANDSIFGETETAEIWRRSAEFMIHQQGPTGLAFNFADSKARTSELTAAQTWIAARFPRSGLSASVRSALEQMLKNNDTPKGSGNDRLYPLHLLWLPPLTTVTSAPLALTARFGGEQEIACARTLWDSDAAWLAIKGGTGAASHGHLDAGSFVYDAAGVRWFFDLGSDDYNMPGYFGKQRWDYLRLNNRSHNTLVIGDALQLDPEQGCPVTPWVENGMQSQCEIDLSSVYAKQCASAKRHVSFDRSQGRVEMSDKIRKPMGAVRWAVVTDADVKIEGQKVLLQKNGKTLVLQRDDAAGGAWQEFSLVPATMAEEQNKDYRMVGFLAPAQEELDLRVSWQMQSNKKSP